MEHNQQGERNSAAEDFEKSLDQLQHLLEENQAEEQPSSELEAEKIPQKPEVKQPQKFDLAEWEDAVADIEQYFENKEKEN